MSFSDNCVKINRFAYTSCGKNVAQGSSGRDSSAGDTRSVQSFAGVTWRECQM